MWGTWDLTSRTRDRTKAQTVKVLVPNHCTTRKLLVLFSQRSQRSSSNLTHRRTPKIQEWLHSPPHTHIYMCYAQSLSHVWLFVTPWTIPCQAPLSMGFPKARKLEWVAISVSITPRVTPRVTLYCIARVHARISKGKGTWGEIHKKPGLRFHMSFLGKGYEDDMSLPWTACDSTCVVGVSP